jgi:hypothetical protein
MTEAEAQEKCARLAREDPDRKTHRWRPREEADGSWSVVKIALPVEGAGTPETRADEKPVTPDDPRTAAMRNLGPNIGPGL